MGRIVVLYLQLLLQGMAAGRFHNIGLFLQGTRMAWGEGGDKTTERSVENAITNHLGCRKIKDQLDVTCYIISLLTCPTCFGH